MLCGYGEFNSFRRNDIWKILDQRGVEKRLINCIKEYKVNQNKTYKRISIRIREAKPKNKQEENKKYVENRSNTQYNIRW